MHSLYVPVTACFFGQFGINSSSSFQKHDQIEGNFFMFLKTNEGYLSQITPKNM